MGNLPIDPGKIASWQFSVISFNINAVLSYPQGFVKTFETLRDRGEMGRLPILHSLCRHYDHRFHLCQCLGGWTSERRGMSRSTVLARDHVGQTALVEYTFGKHA